jgi:hypothetical protein
MPQPPTVPTFSNPPLIGPTPGLKLTRSARHHVPERWAECRRRYCISFDYAVEACSNTPMPEKRYNLTTHGIE